METSVHELTAGYALDALEPAEREAYEAHLGDCPQCQEELASFWEVAGALAAAADGPAPSPDLRDRILAAARAEQQNVVPIESKRRRVTPVLAAVTAIAAAVAIGLGIYAHSLNGQLDDTKSALTAQQQASAVLADPNATTVALKEGSGRLVVGANGAAVLTLDDLGSAPSGKTYQAWVVEGTTPVSAGTFAASSGHAVVPIPQPVPNGAVVAVTIEDAGGASAPTLPTVAASNPV
jgi:anti-sigma-K factor RskA